MPQSNLPPAWPHCQTVVISAVLLTAVQFNPWNVALAAAGVVVPPLAGLISCQCLGRPVPVRLWRLSFWLPLVLFAGLVGLALGFAPVPPVLVFVAGCVIGGQLADGRPFQWPSNLPEDAGGGGKPS